MAAIHRRRFLVASGTVALSRVYARGKQTAVGRKLKVVVAGGHPGDPEYGCGGTISRYAEMGHEVTLLYLNRGEKGCAAMTNQRCGDLRTAEARNACKLLGAVPKFAGQVDGEADVNPATYDKFDALLQAESLDVVFTHWLIDNHRDHRAISNLVYDAWLRAGKKFSLYFYEVSDGEDTLMFSPTDYVDIGQTEAKKRSACFAHASQSPEHFYALQTEVMRFRGTESGYGKAEAFIRHRESPSHLLP